MVNEILLEVIKEELAEKGQIKVLKDSKVFVMKDLLYVGARDDYQLTEYPFAQDKVWLKDFQTNWDFEAIAI
jgi:hypothetical protein